MKKYRAWLKSTLMSSAEVIKKQRQAREIIIGTKAG
jgi:hypothetical protein